MYNTNINFYTDTNIGRGQNESSSQRDVNGALQPEDSQIKSLATEVLNNEIPQAENRKKLDEAKKCCQQPSDVHTLIYYANCLKRQLSKFDEAEAAYNRLFDNVNPQTGQPN